MLQPNLEFNPKKKKSRTSKIIAQIVSTMFTTVFVLCLIIGVFSSNTDYKYVPFEEVNLYNTNYDDVYEMKDLKVISKYTSDETDDYYLVALPYKDEQTKVASFRCSKNSSNNLDKAMTNKNSECFLSVGVTIDHTDMLFDDTKADYDNAIKNLKESGMNFVSTELSFEYICNTDDSYYFERYCSDEKSFNRFMSVMCAVLTVVGIVPMYFSFREKKDDYQPEQVYSASSRQRTYFDPDFDNRFQKRKGLLANW